jgi:hypothetical protein
MGELVALRPRGCGSRSPQACSDIGDGAEILFFTGVRFARFDDYIKPPKRKRNVPRRRAPRRAERAER